MIPLAPAPARSLYPVPADTIRVGFCLPSQLWNQLLVEAINQLPGFAAGVGSAELLTPAWNAPEPDPPSLPIPPSSPRPAGAAAAVLVAAVPGHRAGWERLGHWCRRGDRVRVLVLGENRPGLAARTLRLGASGYLDWESPLAVLAKAIRGVAAGELWAERKIALMLMRSPPPAASRLTRRELHVLEALADGKRNKEIAALLSISETTVKSHLNRAYHKLHLSDRLQAALYVERHGLEPGL